MSDNNIVKKKIISNLNDHEASIISQKFVDIDGALIKIGKDHIETYVNTEYEIERLISNEPDYIVKTVFVFWQIELPTEE